MMMAVTLKRYYGEEKTYLVYDVVKNEYAIDSKRARVICDPRYGIGCDGIIMGPYHEKDGIHMAILNPDGSETAASYEAMCVFARYLKDNAYVEKKYVPIHTKGDFVIASYLNEAATHIRLSKGKEIFVSDETMREDEFILNGDVGYIGTTTLGYEFLAKLDSL
ncbi:MAG: hypothetical protein ACOYBL_00695 [Lachnospiraceae bacterium]